MEEYTDEYELIERDDVSPVRMCMMCEKRPIWAFHINRMRKGRRCVCQSCRAIHVIKGGEITVEGFKG